jgi:hypothetical protein
MKKILVVSTMLFGFATMGFDCIVDGFGVAVSLTPVTETFNVTNGSIIASSSVIVSTELYDTGFDIEEVTLYDIKVRTIGSAGTCGAIISINNIQIIAANGPWTSFNTAQSVLTSSLIARNQPGITALINAVKNGDNFVISGQGTATGVPNGSQIIIEVYMTAKGTL